MIDARRAPARSPAGAARSCDARPRRGATRRVAAVVHASTSLGHSAPAAPLPVPCCCASSFLRRRSSFAVLAPSPSLPRGVSSARRGNARAAASLFPRPGQHRHVGRGVHWAVLFGEPRAPVWRAVAGRAGGVYALLLRAARAGSPRARARRGAAARVRPSAAATSLARSAPALPPPQFFKDIDGAYVANVRLYDPAVVDLAPKVRRFGAARRRGLSARARAPAPSSPAAARASARSLPLDRPLLSSPSLARPFLTEGRGQGRPGGRRGQHSRRVGRVGRAV